jgi:hypothetical protein
MTLTQRAFNTEMLAIISETKTKRVDAHAAKSRIEIKFHTQMWGSEWTAYRDSFATSYPVEARRLRRRRFSRRVRRGTSYWRPAMLWLRSNPIAFGALVAQLAGATETVDVAILKARAGVTCNANFNPSIARVLRRTLPAERWKLIGGRQVVEA